MQQSKNPIELVDGQDLAHASVVIQNKGALVFCGVVVAHSGLRTAHEGRIAEDHPWLFLAGYEAIPENAERCGSNLATTGQTCPGGVAGQQKSENTERG